ncbi:hypothetical protein [Erysipelothrix urinaevulpis]|uniref:hypothetical protein n=1 Tax=Erysipelothrix urinaevulpis TaxID=2683717 RepID=UPI00135AB40D|nr:hypothetical protein [Erysipelothrix urinaevulpis]
MIIVNSPLMQDEIKAAVEAIESPTFTFVKKDGIRLYFETESEDLEAAVKIAKTEIKNMPNATALFFSVVAG